MATDEILQEIKDHEQQADELFKEGRKLLISHHDISELTFKQRLMTLEEDWKNVQSVSLEYRTRLQEKQLLQVNFIVSLYKLMMF